MFWRLHWSRHLTIYFLLMCSCWLCGLCAYVYVCMYDCHYLHILFHLIWYGLVIFYYQFAVPLKNAKFHWHGGTHTFCYWLTSSHTKAFLSLSVRLSLSVFANRHIEYIYVDTKFIACLLARLPACLLNQLKTFSLLEFNKKNEKIAVCFHSFNIWLTFKYTICMNWNRLVF